MKKSRLSKVVIGTKMNDNYNIGLCILRIIMCFEVVLRHYWNHKEVLAWQRPFYMIEMDAVPVFMLISFYLMQKTFLARDPEKIRKRLWRIIWPQIGWAIAYWVVYALVELFTGKNKINGITDLFWQILGGHSTKLNASMWYQTALIILSLLFFAIFTFLKVKTGMVLIYVLMTVSMIMQYAGVNYELFEGFRTELQAPLGRIIEMIPYATLGFSLAYFNVFDKLKANRMYVAIGAIITGLFISKYDIFSTEVLGFQYQGMEKIATAVLFVTIGILLPFEKLPEILKNLLKFFSRYTLGIYCIHRMIAYFIIQIWNKQG